MNVSVINQSLVKNFNSRNPGGLKKNKQKDSLITSDYQGIGVSFTEDGWFNATEVADKFGKRPVDWLSLSSTQEYIEVLADMIRSEKSSLLKIKRGGRGKSDSTWMHPDLAVPFARWIDVRFSIWCDQQIKQIISMSHPYYDWKRLRHEASSSNKVMNRMLQMARDRLGKTCAPHHYSNEARMINYVLTGQFCKIDRNELEPGDLDLLAKLETLDTILLGCGTGYEARKKELEQYAAEQRSSHTGLELKKPAEVN